MAKLPKEITLNITVKMPITYKATADNQLVMSVQPPTKSIVKIAKICAKHNFDMEVSINEQQEQ